VSGAWDELVSVALIGTERKPPPESTVAAAGAVVAGDVRAATDEQTVLAAAAVLGAHRRAGLVTPRLDTPPPDAAPADVAPEAPDGAARLLELVLEGHVSVAGGSTPVAVEWLERCAATGRRVPARLLPAILDRAAVVRELRGPALAAGGPLLRWLAARNDAWSWAAGAAATAGDPTVWATGDGDRFAVLAAADPAPRLAMVGATWSGERAADRARIVELLDDEPFLEAALDDRAASVRAAAAARLATMPGSRLAARMAARLEPLVGTGGRLRRKLEVRLPEALDDAARRDGIVDAGVPAGTGLHAWWLVQIVASTPLSWWTARFGGTATDLVAVPHPAEVRTGWVQAAARQRDAAWAEALLGVAPGAAALLAVLPPGTAHAALERSLPAAKDAAVAKLLAAVPGPWPAGLSRAVLARLRVVKGAVAVEHALGVVATRADPSVGEDVEGWLAGVDDDRRRRLVREAAHALSIRQTIARELP
jgi:hypothetical protein